MLALRDSNYPRSILCSSPSRGRSHHDCLPMSSACYGSTSTDGCRRGTRWPALASGGARCTATTVYSSAVDVPPPPRALPGHAPLPSQVWSTFSRCSIRRDRCQGMVNEDRIYESAPSPRAISTSEGALELDRLTASQEKSWPQPCRIRLERIRCTGNLTRVSPVSRPHCSARRRSIGP